MESGTPKTRNTDRNLKAEDDALQAMDVSMTFITYDARRILETMKVSLKARVYDQAMLIIWCHNFGINRTYETLLAYEQSSIRATILTVEKANAFDRQRQHSEAMAKIRSIKNQKKQRLSSREAKIDLKRVIYDPKLILYLYTIDQEILLADYDVRLDRLFVLLHDIQEEDLLVILGELQESRGRCHMWSVFQKLEEHFGVLLRNMKDPEGYHHYVPEKQGSMPVDMQERLQKFLDTRKKARGEDGSR